MSSSPDPDQLLCHCLGVPYGVVEHTIRAGGLRKVDEVTAACKAGGGCRSCHPEIQEILDRIKREQRGAGLVQALARLLGRRTR